MLMPSIHHCYCVFHEGAWVWLSCLGFIWDRDDWLLKLSDCDSPGTLSLRWRYLLSSVERALAAEDCYPKNFHLSTTAVGYAEELPINQPRVFPPWEDD